MIAVGFVNAGVEVRVRNVGFLLSAYPGHHGEHNIDHVAACGVSGGCAQTWEIAVEGVTLRCCGTYSKPGEMLLGIINR